MIWLTGWLFEGIVFGAIVFGILFLLNLLLIAVNRFDKVKVSDVLAIPATGAYVFINIEGFGGVSFFVIAFLIGCLIIYFSYKKLVNYLVKKHNKSLNQDAH